MSSTNGHPDLADALWDSATATMSTISHDSMSDSLFHEHAHRHRLPARAADAWPTDPREISLPDAVTLMRTRVGAQDAAVLAVDGTVAHIRLARGRVTVSVAGADIDACEGVLERFRSGLPKPRIPAGDPRVSISFSWKAERGVGWDSRTLDVSRWAQIAANYPPPTRDRLDRLMGEFRPGRSGQTLVWHGDPGTGKTHALRALAWEWREWCDVHVVADPDQLFDQDAGYLMDVITAAGGVGLSEERYRLLALEDSGELLSADARRRVGHGLSRFLNVCDGLLGQAEKLILLVTTNEPMQRLHPAVRRTGRCAADVEYLPFDRRAANRWLAKRCDARVGGPTALADLWALADGREPEGAAADEPIGFARALERDART